MSKKDFTPLKDARWAQDPADVEAVSAIADPGGSKQNNGWNALEKPGRKTSNWWMNHVGNWLGFLNATVGKLFSTNFVLRNGNPVAGFVTTTRVAADDWTIDANAANIWSEGSAYEVDALVGASVDPTHGGTATFNTYYTVVATPTGIVVREGVEGAPTPVEPTLLDGDVELAQLLLGPGAITHTPTDLRQRGSFVGGRVAAETLFRVGKLVSGWAIEATDAYLTVDVTGDVSIDAGDALSLVGNTVSIDGPITVANSSARWGSVAAIAFRLEGVDPPGASGAGIAYVGNFSDLFGFASLPLPHGAVLSELRFHGEGFGAGGDMKLKIVRHTLATGVFSVVVESPASFGAGAFEQVTAFSHTVDLDLYAYSLRMEILQQTDAVLFTAARIKYTIDSL